MPCVGGLDVGDGKLGDRARAVRDTVQTCIMERHQDTVASQVHIGLEIAIAERDGGRERRQRVLRGLAGPPRCAKASGARPPRNG
jgi:hypothetical protein